MHDAGQCIANPVVKHHLESSCEISCPRACNNFKRLRLRQHYIHTRWSSIYQDRQGIRPQLLHSLTRVSLEPKLILRASPSLQSGRSLNPPIYENFAKSAWPWMHPESRLMYGSACPQLNGCCSYSPHWYNTAMQAGELRKENDPSW